MPSEIQRRPRLSALTSLAKIATVRNDVTSTTARDQVPRGDYVMHQRGALLRVERMPDDTSNCLLEAGAVDVVHWLTAGNLTAQIGRLVFMNGAPRRVTVATAAGQRIVGVLTHVEAAVADSPCIVRVLGPCWVINSGGLSEGDAFTTTNAGAAIAPPAGAVVHGADVDAGYMAGICLTNAGNGLLTHCLLTHSLLPTHFI